MFNTKFEKIIDFIADKGMWIIIAILALFAYTLIITNIYYNKGVNDTVSIIQQQDGTEVKTNTIIKYDTITEVKPVPKYINKTKTVTDTLQLHTTDTLKQLVTVDIPITQKIYGTDSTYLAYVSGYKCNLDSIDIYNRTKTITNTITRTIKKTPLITVQPQIGYGYGLNSKHFEPSVGISIGMPIFTIYRKN